MADLPPPEQINSFNWEIHAESRHVDDRLIWLSSDEAATTLNPSSESFDAVTMDVHAPEMISSECSAEDPSAIPVSARQPSNDIDDRLLPSNSSAGDGPAGMLFGSVLLSHKTFAQFNLTRRLLRVAALVSVLLIGSVLPSILGHLRPTRVKASAAVPGRLTQSAGHPMSRLVRVLTVQHAIFP